MGGQLVKALDRLGGSARVMVVAIALGTVLVAIYLVMSAGEAAMTPAFTGLDAKSAAQVQSTLAGAGISSKLGDGGKTVLVPSAKVAEARVAVGNAGVDTANGSDPWQKVYGASLGTTDQQMQVRMQNARAAAIEQQIEQIAGVRSARVTLALPPDTIFSDDRRQPTAAVVVDTGPGILPDETIRGIVRLVAAAVPGLTLQNVTVTDQRGLLLNQAYTSVGLEVSDRLSAETAYARRQAAKAQAQLDALLGPGKAVVTVDAILALDSAKTVSQTFGKTAGALQASKETEKLQSQNKPAAGAAGTAANVPGAAAQQGTSTSNYSHNKDSSANALDTTKTETDVVAGTPAKLQVAVVVDKQALGQIVTPYNPTALQKAQQQAKSGKLPAAVTLNPQQLTAAQTVVEQTVKKAVGWESKRDGKDSFSLQVTEQLVDPVTALTKSGAVVTANGTAASAAGGGPIGMVMGYLRPAAAIVGLLVFLFLVRRSLKKRQSLLATTDSSWLPALEAPPIKVDEILAQLNQGPSAAELAAIEKKQLYGRVEELALRRPNEAAAQLRGWLTEES